MDGKRVEGRVGREVGGRMSGEARMQVKAVEGRWWISGRWAHRTCRGSASRCEGRCEGRGRGCDQTIVHTEEGQVEHALEQRRGEFDTPRDTKRQIGREQEQ